MLSSEQCCFQFYIILFAKDDRIVELCRLEELSGPTSLSKSINKHFFVYVCVNSLMQEHHACCCRLLLRVFREDIFATWV